MQNVEVYRSKLGKKLDNSLLYVANIKGKVEALWFLYDINNLKENTDKVKIDVKEICVVTDYKTYAYKSIPVNLSFIDKAPVVITIKIFIKKQIYFINKHMRIFAFLSVFYNSI